MPRRDKFAEIPTTPMFPEPTKAPKERQRRPPPSGHGRCPRCQSGAKVRIEISGRHKVWAEHTYRSWGGAPITCQASGVPLCRLPVAKATDLGFGITCDHPPSST